MTATKYIILTLIAIVASSLVVSMSGIDPMLNTFLADGILVNFLRIGILGLLVTLLFTDPPRSARLRTISGAASAIMLVMCMAQFAAFNTYVIDAIVYLELAIIFAIESLEVSEPASLRRVMITRRHKASV